MIPWKLEKSEKEKGKGGGNYHNNKFCNYCKQSGHDYESCWKRQREKGAGSTTPGPTWWNSARPKGKGKGDYRPKGKGKKGKGKKGDYKGKFGRQKGKVYGLDYSNEDEGELYEYDQEDYDDGWTQDYDYGEHYDEYWSQFDESQEVWEELPPSAPHELPQEEQLPREVSAVRVVMATTLSTPRRICSVSNDYVRGDLFDYILVDSGAQVCCCPQNYAL